MEIKETQQALEDFKKYVIRQSRTRLTRLKHNDTKKLYNSLKGEVFTGKNSIGMYFSMEDWGFYQDKGVKGKDPSKVSKNAKIRGQQAPNSPYSFKNKRPPSEPLSAWAKRKNIRLRDEKGKYKKGNYNTIGFILAKNIWARGLKPTLFFTKPFEDAYKRLPTDLVDKYGLDVTELFKISIKQPKR